MTMRAVIEATFEAAASCVKTQYGCFLLECAGPWLIFMESFYRIHVGRGSFCKLRVPSVCVHIIKALLILGSMFGPLIFGKSHLEALIFLGL